MTAAPLISLHGSSPSDVGNHSEAMVAARLIGRGWAVCVPLGSGRRYDYIIEREGTMYRVQTKTGRLKSGAIVFPTCSSYAHRGRPVRGYNVECDAFGVYCPDNDEVYLVPIIETTGLLRKCVLRIETAMNNQHKNVRYATRFRIDK
jgi:hypothetical protein